MSKDPLEEVVKGISKPIQHLADMIFDLAKRTLSAKEFIEFMEEWKKKSGDGEHDDP